MEILNFFDLSAWQWTGVVASAILLGFSKTGLNGAFMLAVPIVAGVFGGKDSTGILLPMLLVGDAFAIWYYNRHAEWNNIKKLLPWNLCGLLLGVAVGNRINDSQFKILIAISILICLGVLIYTEIKGSDLNIPEKTWLYAALGVLCGFTSMIGNAAGPIFSIYLLARGFNKNDFMGTAAWFFLITNVTKVPLQIFLWRNVSLKTVVLTVEMLPAIAAGAILGAIIMKKINERVFRHLILFMTAIAAIKLFI